MIASFSKQFIFVKTRKTGGTSAEIVLSAWCSDEDICSPLGGEDELIRYARGAKARNFIDDPAVLAAYEETVSQGNPEAINAFHKQHKKTFYNHMPAVEVLTCLPDLWERAYKFTIDRHPYERAVSRVYWNTRKMPKFDFESFLDKTIESKSFPSAPLYTLQGKVIVDEVIPYDSMWDRIRAIGQTLGTTVGELPRAKGNVRKDRRPAHEILSQRQKQRIYERCAFEFELMGFTK